MKATHYYIPKGTGYFIEYPRTLVNRIDETREAWRTELETCRNEILDAFRTTRLQNPPARLVVELDYLLVEAKLALEAKEKG